MADSLKLIIDAVMEAKTPVTIIVVNGEGEELREIEKEEKKEDDPFSFGDETLFPIVGGGGGGSSEPAILLE